MNLCRVILFALAVATLYAQDTTKPPPRFEDYLGKKHGATNYLRAALHYLSQEPGNRYKARVALDIVMVAEMGQLDELANDAREIILMRMGQSVHSAHLMKTYSAPDDYKMFLQARLTKLLRERNKAAARYYCNGVERGIQHFGKTFMSGNSLVVLTYCMAESAGRKVLREGAAQSLPALRKEDEKVDAILKVCFDAGKPAAYRVAQLDKLEGPMATTLRRFYLMYVSDVETKDPTIGRIAARTAYGDQRYKEALALVNGLPKGEQDKGDLLVLRALCLHHLKLTTEAEDALARVKAGPWAPTAAKILAGRRIYQQQRNLLAEGLQKAAAHMKKDFGQTLFTGAYTDEESGKAYRFFVEFDIAQNRLRALLQQEGATVFAMTCSSGGTRIYYRGSPKILVVPEFSVMPMPQIALTRSRATGEFRLNFNIKVAESLDKAAQEGAKILDSPYVSTKEGALKLLDYSHERHTLVTDAPKSTPDGVTYTFYRPDVASPEMMTFSLTFTKDWRLRRIQGRNGSMELSQGKVGFKMPELPKLPEDVVTDKDAFLRLMQFVFSAMQDLTQ